LIDCLLISSDLCQPASHPPDGWPNAELELYTAANERRLEKIPFLGLSRYRRASTSVLLPSVRVEGRSGPVSTPLADIQCILVSYSSSKLCHRKWARRGCCGMALPHAHECGNGLVATPTRGTTPSSVATFLSNAGAILRPCRSGSRALAIELSTIVARESSFTPLPICWRVSRDGDSPTPRSRVESAVRNSVS